MSRRCRPSLPTAATKLSRVLRKAPRPKAARLEAAVEPPTRASCAPLLSSTIENTTRPMSERTTRPRLSAALHCTFTVSAGLMRSEGSAWRQATTETVALPSRLTRRKASPRRKIVVQYQPPGTSSRRMTSPSGMATAPGSVGGGRAFGVAFWPAARKAS